MMHKCIPWAQGDKMMIWLVCLLTEFFLGGVRVFVSGYEETATVVGPKTNVVSIILGTGFLLVVVILIVLFARVCLVRRSKKAVNVACEYGIWFFFFSLQLSQGSVSTKEDWRQKQSNKIIQLSWIVVRFILLPQEASISACWTSAFCFLALKQIPVRPWNFINMFTWQY